MRRINHQFILSAIVVSLFIYDGICRADPSTENTVPPQNQIATTPSGQTNSKKGPNTYTDLDTQMDQEFHHYDFDTSKEFIPLDSDAQQEFPEYNTGTQQEFHPVKLDTDKVFPHQ